MKTPAHTNRTTVHTGAVKQAKEVAADLERDLKRQERKR